MKYRVKGFSLFRHDLIFDCEDTVEAEIKLEDYMKRDAITDDYEFVVTSIVPIDLPSQHLL